MREKPKQGRHIKCQDCGINQLCLPSMLAKTEIEELDSIVQNGNPVLVRGDVLFNAGDDFSNLYVVKAGSLKSCVVSYTGEEQITAFHLPGEIIGLDAINSNVHKSSAIALADSRICRIPYEKLEGLMGGFSGLRKQVIRLLSKEITDDQELLVLLGQKKANEKMAAFFLNLSSRYKIRKLSALDFELPMSRKEMACYLGLTIETVSRILKSFKEKKMIVAKGRHIEILNLDALNQLAGFHCQFLSH